MTVGLHLLPPHFHAFMEDGSDPTSADLRWFGFGFAGAVFEIHTVQTMLCQVINQLTCYIYVFLFFGVVISVIVTDVLSKACQGAHELEGIGVLLESEMISTAVAFDYF